MGDALYVGLSFLFTAATIGFLVMVIRDENETRGSKLLCAVALLWISFIIVRWYYRLSLVYDCLDGTASFGERLFCAGIEEFAQSQMGNFWPALIGIIFYYGTLPVIIIGVLIGGYRWYVERKGGRHRRSL
jgi:hypothetical protein